jgi:hypothetical protein
VPERLRFQVGQRLNLLACNLSRYSVYSHSAEPGHQIRINMVLHSFARGWFLEGQIFLFPLLGTRRKSFNPME